MPNIEYDIWGEGHFAPDHSELQLCDRVFGNDFLSQNFFTGSP